MAVGRSRSPVRCGVYSNRLSSYSEYHRGAPASSDCVRESFLRLRLHHWYVCVWSSSAGRMWLDFAHDCFSPSRIFTTGVKQLPNRCHRDRARHASVSFGAIVGTVEACTRIKCESRSIKIVAARRHKRRKRVFAFIRGRSALTPLKREFVPNAPLALVFAAKMATGFENALA